MALYTDYSPEEVESILRALTGKTRMEAVRSCTALLLNLDIATSLDKRRWSPEWWQRRWLRWQAKRRVLKAFRDLKS